MITILITIWIHENLSQLWIVWYVFEKCTTIKMMHCVAMKSLYHIYDRSCRSNG